MGRTWRTVVWLAGAIGLPLLAAGVRADATAVAPAAESYRLERGVIVERAGTTAYVLGKSEGIDALDARTLKLRAHTAAAVMPLLLFKGRLLALAASGAPLRLVWLDARTLARRVECAPVALPEFAQPSPVDGLGSSFELSADRQGQQIYVRWTAETSYVGGVPPTPQQQAAASRHAEGVVRVDWQTGATEVVPDPPPDTSPIAYGMEVPYAAGPFVVAALQVSVEVPERAGAFDVAVIRRSRTTDHAPLHDVSIALPASLAIWSLDRSHLLVPLLAADGSIARAQLWSLATARPAAQLALQNPPNSCVVAGRQLLFVAQGTLTSVPLARPALSRTHALRPTEYLGPHPPGVPSNAAFQGL